MSARVQRSVDECGNLGVEIVEGVAQANDVDVTEVTQLYTVIDVDALTTLFSSTAGTSRSDGLIKFIIEGCEVTVTSGGDIEVVALD